MTDDPTRGMAYWTDLGHGPKPWLVVSNNHRNRALPTVLAARVTTTLRTLPTRIDLTHEDPLAGQVLCDDLEQVYADDFGNRIGGLTPATMERVGGGLRLALGC